MQVNLTLNQAAMVLGILRAIDRNLRPDEDGKLGLAKMPGIEFTPERAEEFRDAVNKFEQTEV